VRWVVGVGLPLVLVLGCARRKVEPQPVQLPAPVVATLDGREIGTGELEERLGAWLAAQRRTPGVDDVRARRLAIADELTLRELVTRAAGERQLATPDDAALLAPFVALVGGEPAFARYLETTGETRAIVLERLRTRALLDLLVGPAPEISDDQVARWIEAHPAAVRRPRELQLTRQIWSMRPGLTPEERRGFIETATAVARGARSDRPVVLREGWWKVTELPETVRSWAVASRPGARSPVLVHGDAVELVTCGGERAAVERPLAEVQAEARETLRRAARDVQITTFLDGERRRIQVKEPLRDALLAGWQRSFRRAAAAPREVGR
jgi:hypothetical protein